jgi:hypothetical protein
LAAAAQEIEMAELSPHAAPAVETAVSVIFSDDVSPAECLGQNPQAADLIAFNDSPFISDPSVTDFESIWNGLDDSSGARGWCDVSLEDIIKGLESMEDTLKVIPVEELPFVGKCSLGGRRC